MSFGSKALPTFGLIATVWVSLAVAMGPLSANAELPASADADRPIGPAQEEQHRAAPHEIRRSSDGLFYINAVVNGEPVRFLVDTGSTHVVLTASDARRVNAHLQDGSAGTRLRTAGGSSEMAWTTLDSVELAGRSASDLKAVVAQGALPVSLLGQNMLSQLASITIEGDRLLLR